MRGRSFSVFLLAALVHAGLSGVGAAASVPGDLDGDEAITLSDLALLNGCLLGPNMGSVPPECAAGDFTLDGDVDLHDFAAFQLRFGLVLCDPTWSQVAVSSPETNGTVYAMTVFDDGTGPALYVGGAFTAAGETPANRIARWDGRAWSALGSGVNFWVLALTVFDDGTGEALYAGGAFTRAGDQPVNYIAKWDGVSWSPLGAGVTTASADIEPRVDSLAVYDDGRGTGPALYAGGTFTIAGGVEASRIARWDGATWSPLGAGVSGGVGDPNNAETTVYAMTVFDDGLGGGPALYAGGRFTNAGGVEANRIARWDGATWSALGSGMYNVFALTVFDDGLGAALYAGGAFTTAGGTPASRVALWDGIRWWPAGSGLNDWVNALAVYDDGAGPCLYAAGRFTHAGDLPTNHIAKWDGSAWSPLGAGLDRTVEALQMYVDGNGPALFVGGAFTQAGGQPSPYLAKWSRPPPPCP